MDCSPPGSSVHGIFQAKILEWVAISFSRGSSGPRYQTWVSCIDGYSLPTELWGKPQMRSDLKLGQDFISRGMEAGERVLIFTAMSSDVSKKKNAAMLAKTRGRTIQAWSGGSWVPNVQRWRRRWQPTPVLLSGKCHGRRSLVGYSPRGREESGTTERLHFDFLLPCIGEGYGNLFQDSCLENPRDRGAWWAAVYGVAQSWTRLKRLSSSNVQSNLGRRASFFFK